MAVPERNDLAVVAALIGPTPIKGPARWASYSAAPAPGRLTATPKRSRNRTPTRASPEMVAGVEVEDADRRVDLGKHLNEAATLGPKCGSPVLSAWNRIGGRPSEGLWLGRRRLVPH